MSYWVNRAFILFFCVFTQATQASILSGIDWLNNQVNPNGSIATVSDLSSAYQSTSEALRAFHATNSGDDATLQAASTFLGENTFYSTEHLARAILVGTELGDTVSTHVSELLAHQNRDGGFGELSGYDSTTLV